jgi:hypothetical protein
MFSDSSMLTSWAGCPQSRLYQEVVALGDRRAARILTRVARQWDHTLAPRWLVRLLPRRLQPARFDVAGYRAVAALLSEAALRDTLEHVDWLRRQPAVRGSLASVAFLEAFEAASAAELERRRRVPATAAAQRGALRVMGRRPVRVSP